MLLDIHHINYVCLKLSLYFSVPHITQAPSTDYRILFIYDLQFFFLFSCLSLYNKTISNHITHIEVALYLKPTLPCSAK